MSHRLVFRLHVVQRMFERRIGMEEGRRAIEAGDVIEEYPDDTPFPSRLILGRRGSNPLHVVAAEKEEYMNCVICKHGETYVIRGVHVEIRDFAAA